MTTPAYSPVIDDDVRLEHHHLECRSASVTSCNTRGRVNPEMSSGAMTRSPG